MNMSHFSDSYHRPYFMGLSIIPIANILPILSFTLLLTGCDSGSDNDTVANWFCAIVFLLALLKGGK